MRRGLIVLISALAFTGAANAATTLAIAPGTVGFGKQATFSGTVTPASGGVSVQIVRVADGSPVGSTTTAPDGTYSFQHAVYYGGSYQAVASTGTSAAAAIQLTPRLVATVQGKRALGAKLTLRGRLRPAEARGPAPAHDPREDPHGEGRAPRAGSRPRSRATAPAARSGR